MKAHQRLREDFLAPFYAKGDSFPNLLARSTYLSKYSRDGEAWTDTIRRVVEGNCDLDPNVTEEEMQLLFYVFWTMQALPPGRGLWVGGIPGIPADARYNCFSKETKFWANKKLVTLGEMVGHTVDVRCVDGEWRPAEVKCFGTQKLFTYRLHAPGNSKFFFEYEATENHRWITENRGIVTDFKVGDKVRVTPDTIDKESENYKKGLADGRVFGGGWLPDPASTFEYQAGLLDGWLNGKNQLRSINRKALDWVIDRAPFLGYCVTEFIADPSSQKEEGLPVLQLTLTPESVVYTVRQKIDEGKEEEVYCVTEPVTHTFTIQGGVRTGQCWYTGIYNTKDWGWVANQLMLGGGVGVGLNEVGRLPIVQRESQAMFQVFCQQTHPNFGDVKPDQFGYGSYIPNYRIVEDSREGWVDALNFTLDSAYLGRSVFLDVSKVRARGLPIKTFGGTACGPGPLVDLLRATWSIIRGAEGRRLSSVEALDVTNHIGKCIKAGNVRRSALIALGEPHDQDFRDAKKDWGAVASHRHTSNNSIAFREFKEFEKFNWKGLAMDNIEFGEPGVLNLALGRQTDPGAMGVNPCYSGDTLIQTKGGHFRIKDLVGKAAEVWDGQAWRAVNTFEVTGRDKQLLKITMQDGTELRVTKNHKMVLEGQRQMIEASDLQVGVKLELAKAELTHGSIHAKGAYLKGFLLGDGSLTGGEQADLWLYSTKATCKERLLASGAEIEPSAPVKGAITELAFTTMDEQRDRLQGLSVRKELAPWCAAYKEGLPAEVFTWGAESKMELLAGLFDADGTAQDASNGFRYQLSMVSKKFLLDVQLLLKTLGVQSKVSLTKPAGSKDFGPDRGGVCPVQALYRLTISQESSIFFAQQAHFARLTSFAKKQMTYSLKTKRNIVVSIEPDEMASEVYCLVTNDPDRIALTNGLLVGRCGEQLLWDREACNLAEVFPANFDGVVSPEKIFKLVARYCLRQRLTPLLDDLSNEVGRKNMRVGVGLGGICDFAWTEALLGHWFKTVREACNDYADELHVAHPITTTTVKPSGTISLLCGSSPGLHAPFAPFYIRRTRHAKNDPMVASLMEAGVKHEIDEYDSSGNTLVFTFPMKAKHTEMTVQTETTRDQFERQLKVQRSWADNAVSCTVSFDKNDPEELADCLREYVPQLKSTSCLPRAHGYKQAPYEEISQEKFNQLSVGIDFNARLKKGADFEIEECTGGVCPVR